MNLAAHRLKSQVTNANPAIEQAPSNLQQRWREPTSKVVAFCLLVIIPVAISLFYTFFLAVTLYKSETSFTIRSRSGGPAIGGLSQITQQLGVGLDGSNDLHAISAYLKSGEALEHLEQKVNYRSEIGRPHGDPLLDLGSAPGATAILKRFRSFFEVRVSTFEQIITIEARGYSPKMAQATAAAGIEVAESFVNRMNLRANQDFLRHSKEDLRASQERVKQTRVAITRWRNANGSVNPAMQIQTVQTNLNTLEQELSKVKAKVSQYSTPRMQDLRESQNALKQQITKERARLAGSSAALAPLIAEFEELEIERELADHQYKAATQAFLAAQQEVSQQQKYIVTVSQPTRGDEPSFPRPFFHNACLALACLAIYGIFMFALNVFADNRKS
jgi:capsular polysaccharide transport system permease protein